MDLSMPNMDGFEATREIKLESPSTIVLVLTAFEEPEYLLKALRAGASGYVLKHMGSKQIVGAIRRVLDGDSPLNQEVAMQLLIRLIEEVKHKEVRAQAVPLPYPFHRGRWKSSSSLARGQSNQQIAR